MEGEKVTNWNPVIHTAVHPNTNYYVTHNSRFAVKQGKHVLINIRLNLSQTSMQSPRIPGKQTLNDKKAQLKFKLSLLLCVQLYTNPICYCCFY